MNRRKSLLYVLTCLVLLAIFIIAKTLSNSLSINEKQENDAWVTCPIANLNPGELVSCNHAFLYAYRRTNQDKQNIDQYVHLLEDPNSDKSKQPESARNQWRSENEDFFIFFASAPERGCSVELKTIFNRSWKPQEYEAIKELPYFIEQCESRTWDTSGRIYSRKGAFSEYNLEVPRVEWLSNSSVRVHGSWN